MPIQFGSQSANQFRFDLAYNLTSSCLHERSRASAGGALTNKSGANIILVAGLVALTIVGAVVGLAWEFLYRIVPIVLFGAVVLAAVVGGLWVIGGLVRRRVPHDRFGGEPRTIETGVGREVRAARGGWRFFKVGVEMR